MPAPIIQQYPQLANDPQFAADYQQLMSLQGGINWRYLSGTPQVQALVKRLSDRAHAIGVLPPDREISALGDDISVHAVRNAALKAGAFAGGAVAAGPVLGALGAGSGTGAAAAAPATSIGASTPIAGVPAGVTAGGIPVTTGGLPAGASAIGGISKLAAAPAAKAASSVPYDQIIKAGVGALGEYFQNRGTNKAISAEQAANAQATQLQQQYQANLTNRLAQTQDAQRQLFSPYLSLGAGAASTLASRMGLPTGPAPGAGAVTLGGPLGAVPSAASSLTPVNPGNAQGLVPNPQGPPLSDPSAAAQAPAGNTLAQLALSAQRNNAQQQTSSSYPSPQTVTMRAPDGTTGQVPVHQLAFYQAKGATVVGS